jgi:ribonuclease HI
MTIVVYADGLCEPVNPGGVATYGYVVYRDGEKLTEGHGVVSHPDPSNNVAEYSACIHALRWLIGSGLTHEPVEVRSDSQVLIYQLQGLYGVNAPRLIPLHRELRDLAACFRQIAFRWIPREQNAEADALSRKAYEEWIARNPDAFVERYGPYLATEKQRALMERLGIRASPWVSRREASRLIGEALSGRSRAPGTDLHDPADVRDMGPADLNERTG